MARIAATFAVLLMAAACNDPVGTPSPHRATIVGGDIERTVLVSEDRIDTITVRVTDGGGNPIAGMAVAWSQNEPDGTITPIEETTTSAGTARAVWRLSGAPGAWKARATPIGSDPVEKSFTVTSWTVRQLVTSGQHTCVIDTGNQLYCRDSTSPPGTAFTLILEGTSVTMIAGAGDPFCVLASDGKVLCAESREAVLNFVPLAGPDRRFRSIASPPSNNPRPTAVCGIDTNGQLWCWGRNGYSGMLGVGSTDQNLQTADPVAPHIGNGVRFDSVVLADALACALAVDQSLWCWGDNTWGVASSEPIDLDILPEPKRRVLNGYGISSISLSLLAEAACALTVQRRTVCWGMNAAAGLPLGTPLGTPMAVAGADDLVRLLPAASGFVGISSTGTMVSWGAQFFGHTPSMPSGSAHPVHYGRALAGSSAVFHSQEGPYGEACFTSTNGNATVCGNPRYLWDPEAAPATHFWRGLPEP